MATVRYETEEAVFYFGLEDVQQLLNSLVSEYKVRQAGRVLKTISASPSAFIKIKSRYFVFIILDLLKEHQGSVVCKACQKNYETKDLKGFSIGFGETPFSVNELPFKKKGGILKRLLGKRVRMSMFGGKGYRCPEGHELICAVTWIS